MSERNEDWLDAMMENEAYIDDAGFTASVMEQLPPPRKVRARRRNWVLIASAVLGSALSLFILPGGDVLTRVFMETMQAGLTSSAQGISLVSVAVIGLFGAGTAALLMRGAET